MKRHFFFVLAFMLCSCIENRLAKDVEKFMGQQIILSTDWKAVWRGRDTVVTDFTKTPIKLVVYHDSLMCSTCQLNRMNDWDEMVAYADSLAQWFTIIYLFTPKKEDMGKVNMALKAGKFDCPVFIDPLADFVKENPKIPQNQRLHSFLLDRNNRVVLAGNPLYNTPLWVLYKSIIQKMINHDGVLPEKQSI